MRVEHLTHRRAFALALLPALLAAACYGGPAAGPAPAGTVSVSFPPPLAADGAGARERAPPQALSGPREEKMKEGCPT